MTTACSSRLAIPRLGVARDRDAEITSACLDRLAESGRSGKAALAGAGPLLWRHRRDAPVDRQIPESGDPGDQRHHILTGAFLETLGKSDGRLLPLKTLVLANAFLTDEPVAHLPKLFPGLVRLDLRGNLGITDKSREVFEQLPDLKQLQLEGTAVSGEGLGFRVQGFRKASLP